MREQNASCNSLSSVMCSPYQGMRTDARFVTWKLGHFGPTALDPCHSREESTNEFNGAVGILDESMIGVAR